MVPNEQRILQLLGVDPSAPIDVALWDTVRELGLVVRRLSRTVELLHPLEFARAANDADADLTDELLRRHSRQRVDDMEPTEPT